MFDSTSNSRKIRASVAMCTFNGEAFLKEQLNSIVTQTFPPSELVICDDCSKDSTLKILQIFKESCSFPVKIIVNDKNLWVSKNFENAILHCSGEIIVLADQDDIWESFKLEKIIETFQENPECGYVFSNADLINEEGKSLGTDLWQSIGFTNSRLEKYRSGKQLQVMLKGNNFVYGMTMAFRSVYNSTLFPIESRSFDCAHDTWIALMLSAKGVYGVTICESLVQYRQHEKQVAGAGRQIKCTDYFKRIWKSNHEGYLVLAIALESIALRLQYEEKSNKTELYERKQLTDKAKHLRARFTASSLRGVKKMKVVFYEVITGRYGQFSGLFRSILRDLIVFSSKPNRG